MNLKRTAFIWTVAALVGLYGVANAMLWYKKGFTYFESDLFIVITSISFFMILLILPRTVAIMLGSEPKHPVNNCSEITKDEASDLESTSQH